MNTTVTTQALNELLAAHNVRARITGATRGPTVTRYEVELSPGTKPEAVLALARALAYTTATEAVRIQTPIPGKSRMGVEIPNDTRELVTLVDVPVIGGPLTMPLGPDVDGTTLTANLAELPHLLVAGATGSGKSSFLNAMLVTWLSRTTPEQLRLVLVDPKMVELTPYDGVPHLLQPVIIEAAKAVSALISLGEEMDRRYAVMQQAGVRNIDAYRAAGGDIPSIVVVVDELADLMLMARHAAETAIVRIGQKGRAAGIHLVLATQRPSVDVVTGLIKANIPARLAFATASMVDSRVILDQPGAETLLGKGDGLYQPIDRPRPTRFQGAYVDDREVADLVSRLVPEAEPEWPTQDTDKPVIVAPSLPVPVQRAAVAIGSTAGRVVRTVQRLPQVGKDGKQKGGNGKKLAMILFLLGVFIGSYAAYRPASQSAPLSPPASSAPLPTSAPSLLLAPSAGTPSVAVHTTAPTKTAIKTGSGVSLGRRLGGVYVLHHLRPRYRRY